MAMRAAPPASRPRTSTAPVPCPARVSPTREMFEDVAARCRELAKSAHAQLLQYPPEAVDAHMRAIVQESKLLFQKWTMEIVYLVAMHRTMRFNQLKDALPGISSRTLSAKLRSLEENGFVQRVLYEEHPPRVEYLLTREGYVFAQLMTPVVAYLNRRATE